jgi:L-ascorbate metabolism protein UlaG (beta-lactamase superfamily)
MAEHRRRPSHHRPGGGFRNPWPGEDGARERGAFLRWQVQRLRDGVPPDPAPDELPHAAADVAHPRAQIGEIRATWVGHSTFLLQIGGWNILTDPVWSRRVSPVAWLGPERLTPPGLDFDALPPIDVVILSHDHYDHLDRPTIARLHDRFGDALRWITPIGYTDWFDGLGIANVVELDWWQQASLTHTGSSQNGHPVASLASSHVGLLDGGGGGVGSSHGERKVPRPGEWMGGGAGESVAGGAERSDRRARENSVTGGGERADSRAGENSVAGGSERVGSRESVVAPTARLEIVAAPARHWTRRSPFTDADRLWASFALRADDGGAVYFAGDSGYFDGYGEVGVRLGPFDLCLIPIGAYEPRWFMQAAHMNPDEAVRTYLDLGASGDFGGMHWGTFRLTDEPPLEPPVRTRSAWRDAGLDDARLWIPRHGETRTVRAGLGVGAATAAPPAEPSTPESDDADG